MMEILMAEEGIDTYGRIRMYQALVMTYSENINTSSEHTVCRVMEEKGISQQPRSKPNGITNKDREARKSEDLLE